MQIWRTLLYLEVIWGFFLEGGASLCFFTYNSGTSHVPLGFSWACEWGLNWSDHPLNASRVSSTGPNAPSFAVLHVLKPQPLNLCVNTSLDHWASAKFATLTRSSLFFPLASRNLTLFLWVKLYLFKTFLIFFAVFYQHFYGLVAELDFYVISFCNVAATWKPSSPSSCWRQLLRSTPSFFLPCFLHTMKCLFLIVRMLLQFIHVFLKSRTLYRHGLPSCGQTKRSEMLPLHSPNTVLSRRSEVPGILWANYSTTVLAKNRLTKTCMGWKKSKNSHERLEGCWRVK